MAEQTGPVIRDSVRLPISKLIPRKENPQRQDGAVFSNLVESIGEMGISETAVVCGPYDDGNYKVVGGHHKIDAAKIKGATEYPCIQWPALSEEEIDIWVIKLNAIKGELDPWTFTRMFTRLAKQYDPATLRQKMGITSEKEFDRLFKDIRKSLPPEVAKKLAESRNEVRDVSGLARIIKETFAKHGEQLQSNFLVFEYGGKTHMMLHCTDRTIKNLERLRTEAQEQHKDLNHYVNRLLEQYLPDELPNGRKDGEKTDSEALAAQDGRVDLEKD